jgi:hypothetical protein
MELEHDLQLDRLAIIFEREAIELLGMIAGSGLNLLPADLLERDGAADVIEYVGSIFVGAYVRGELQVSILTNDHQSPVLMGYALTFHDSETARAYLHCCRLNPLYADRVTREDVLEEVLERAPDLMTLCPPEDVGFYKRHGFWSGGKTNVPPRTNFLLANQVYGRTVTMVRGCKDSAEVAAFLINDRDLYKVQQLAAGA